MCLKELILVESGGNKVHMSVVSATFYCYFLKVNFRFQAIVCDGCHNLIQKAMNFDYIAIVYVKENDYRIHFLYISKDKAIYLLRNADLTFKKWNIIEQKFIITYKNG